MRSTICLGIVLCVAMLGCDQEPQHQVQPKFPADTRWEAVSADPTVKIVRSEHDVLAFDSATRTFSTNTRFDACIAWTSGHFINAILYNGMSTGSVLIRIDLDAKSLVYCLWTIGLGAIDHSQYRNEITAYVNGGILKIHGSEGAGTFDELRELDSGKLIHVDQAYAKDFPGQLGASVVVK